jgi:hypothetical protein
MLRLVTEPLTYQLELPVSSLDQLLGQHFNHWMIDQMISMMDLFPSFISP